MLKDIFIVTLYVNFDKSVDEMLTFEILKCFGDYIENEIKMSKFCNYKFIECATLHVNTT